MVAFQGPTLWGSQDTSPTHTATGWFYPETCSGAGPSPRDRLRHEGVLALGSNRGDRVERLFLHVSPAPRNQKDSNPVSPSPILQDTMNEEDLAHWSPLGTRERPMMR